MADNAAGRPERPLLGVLLIVLATLMFGVGDTIMKHLAMLYPVPVVAASRYLLNLSLLAAFLYPRVGARLWQTERTWLVLLRGLCLAAATLTMGWALQLMPVGETVAIIYLAPFAVMLLAVPLLGERVSTVGWAGVLFGFVGVLLIARPGGNLDPTGVFFAVVNAALGTAYHLLTRLLSRTETTTAMLFHTALVGAVVFTVLGAPSIGGFAPTLVDLGLMVLLGVLATLGHFLFTAAYREAPASLLAPVNYLHLVWAAGLGWLVFAHVPDGSSLLGMAIITLAGVAIALGSQIGQGIRAGARRSRLAEEEAFRAEP